MLSPNLVFFFFTWSYPGCRLPWPFTAWTLGIRHPAAPEEVPLDGCRHNCARSGQVNQRGLAELQYATWLANLVSVKKERKVNRKKTGAKLASVMRDGTAVIEHNPKSTWDWESPLQIASRCRAIILWAGYIYPFPARVRVGSQYWDI